MKRWSTNVKDNRYFRGRSMRVGERLARQVSAHNKRAQTLSQVAPAYFILSFRFATRRCMNLGPSFLKASTPSYSRFEICSAARHQNEMPIEVGAENWSNFDPD